MSHAIADLKISSYVGLANHLVPQRSPFTFAYALRYHVHEHKIRSESLARAETLLGSRSSTQCIPEACLGRRWQWRPF